MGKLSFTDVDYFAYVMRHIGAKFHHFQLTDHMISSGELGPTPSHLYTRSKPRAWPGVAGSARGMQQNPDLRENKMNKSQEWTAPFPWVTLFWLSNDHL